MIDFTTVALVTCLDEINTLHVSGHNLYSWEAKAWIQIFAIDSKLIKEESVFKTHINRYKLYPSVILNQNVQDLRPEQAALTEGYNTIKIGLIGYDS